MYALATSWKNQETEYDIYTIKEEAIQEAQKCQLSNNFTCIKLYELTELPIPNNPDYSL